MIFAFWNEEIRPRLARCKNIDPNEIKVDALGDLRLLRHAIIHNKGVFSRSAQAKLKVMKDLFAPDAEIVVSHDDMHSLFSALKQGVAVLILDHTGPKPGTPDVTQIVDVAIQRKR